MIRKRYKLGFAVAGAILALHFYALAQTSTGSISGVVQDESSAVIAGVNVTVTNVDTGISRSLLTDASGRYHVPTLIPGHYEVQAQMAGFETAIRKGLQVTVGSEVVVNPVLKVGQVAQTTVVTAEAPIVETATSTMSGLVDDKTIRELPLNGRSFDQLIVLQSSAPMFRSRLHTGEHGMSEAYSVNGARTRSNMFLIDGTEMQSTGVISTLPGGALGKNMGVDAIQEFTVQSSNYSAAYGKRGGGIINIATRSGTNQIHGSAFEYLRNSALDARNFFDQTLQPPPFRRNNFGGALGGPIRKDHSFFFGNYEGLRQGLGLTNLAIVPDANAHQGLLPNPSNRGQFINVGVVPGVKPYLAALYPLPNARSFGDGTGELITSPQEVSTQNFYLVRSDQRISDKDSFFARYNITNASRTTPGLIPLFAAFYRNRDQVATLEHKRAYARTVNVLRFGFTRANLFWNWDAVGSVDPALRFVPEADIVGRIRFASGGPNAPAPLTGGGPETAQRHTFVLNLFDVSDQVFHYRGPHSLQFGVQTQRIQNNVRYGATSRGDFQFNSLADFLAGTAAEFRGLAGASDPTKAWRSIYFSSFIQDDYKVLPNLTLNLGLRYEVFTPFTEASGNRISNYHRQFVDGFMTVDSLPTLGHPFFQSNKNGFAPRIGLAWDPLSNGKLALRAGFGMFFDQIDSEHFLSTSDNPPFVTSLTVTNPPFPNGFSGGSANRPLPTIGVYDFNIRVPTRLQYSFGIQRQITSSSVFNASYVGSASYHLTRNVETNGRRPQILPGGTVFYPATALRLQPALLGSRSILSDSVGHYDSLQLEVNQRVSRGIRYKVSYTYARNIDDASSTSTSQASGNIGASTIEIDRKMDRGLSSFDLRHNLATNFTYSVPGSNLSGLGGALRGGWQLGGIVTLSTGIPVTALTGFNRSRDLSRYTPERPNLKAGANNNPVLGGPDRYFDSNVFELQPAGFYGNLGRNTITGPGFVNVDFSLEKVTSVNERLKVDFRADFFNLLNRANFDLPNNVIFNSNGTILGAAGRIRATVGTSRQIQFGLKLTF